MKRALENANRDRANNQGRITRIRIVSNRNAPNPTANTNNTVVANPVVAPQDCRPTMNYDNETNSEARPPVILGYTYSIPTSDPDSHYTVPYALNQAVPS